MTLEDFLVALEPTKGQWRSDDRGFITITISGGEMPETHCPLSYLAKIRLGGLYNLGGPKEAGQALELSSLDGLVVEYSADNYRGNPHFSSDVRSRLEALVGTEGAQ